MVGYSETNIVGRGGRLERHGFVWEGGAMRDLGTLMGGFSRAWDINDRGEIVGESWVADALGRIRNVATLWSGGTIQNLNDLVDDQHGWTLTQATAIDNGGRILVQAQRAGHARVALLIPRAPA